MTPTALPRGRTAAVARRTLSTMIVLTATLAVAGCDGSTAPHATAPPATTQASDSTPAGQPRLIGYAGGESPGVEVHDAGDAVRLHDAPADFQRFIGHAAQRVADASVCTDGYVGVTVETLRTDGYAVGGVNDCGGYRALWARVDGHWTEVQGTQESWDCAVLTKYAVPSDVVGKTCYDYTAQRERPYQQA